MNDTGPMVLWYIALYDKRKVGCHTLNDHENLTIDHRVIVEKVMEYHFVLSVGSLMEPPSLGLTVVPNFDCHDTITIGETPIPILLLSRV